MSTRTPAGYGTVNPFIVARDVDGLIAFCRHVFDGVDHPDARTIDDDGLVLHAELQIGDNTIMFAERKPGWPYLPSLIQVYVDDVDATLARAVERGAEVITQPTEFFGEVFSRMLDPWGNAWWVYRAADEYDSPDEEAGDGSWEAGEDDGTWEATPELTYIHDTMLELFPRLRERAAD